MSCDRKTTGTRIFLFCTHLRFHKGTVSRAFHERMLVGKIKRFNKGSIGVFSDNYGDCDVNSDYCFSRLPGFLQESNAEILAIDSAGTIYR